MLIDIKEGGLDDPRVARLLAIHVSTARGQTAPGSAHALDLSGLRSPEIRFWTAWDGNLLLGTAALKHLSVTDGELKSMHTAEAYRGKGVGSAMVCHVVHIARGNGLRRLNLETGSWPYFLSARKFYARHGFVDCGPFGEYKPDPNSVFMTLDLMR